MHPFYGSAVAIQRRWRGVLGRREARRLRVERRKRMAAMRIQALFRRRLAQKQFRRDVSRVVTIQAVARGYIARKALRRARTAATRIQARHSSA